MKETEDSRTQTMIAALWRAVAKSLANRTADGALLKWSQDGRDHAIRAAEHVETMLSITSQLYTRKDT